MTTPPTNIVPWPVPAPPTNSVTPKPHIVAPTPGPVPGAWKSIGN